MLFEDEFRNLMNRRAFLRGSACTVGTWALSSLLSRTAGGTELGLKAAQSFGVVNPLHLAPTAKRVIYLFMSGAPSHIDLFDPKPKLAELTGTELPGSIRMGQRI